MNTLIEVVKYSELFLFADNNKLFEIIQTEQDSFLLQYGTGSVYNWTLNSLLFIMHVDSKSTGFINQDTYKMNDNILGSKLELKDLGVIVDNHLTFSNHIAEKVNKANQIMELIWRTFVFLDKHTFNLLYKSLVRLDIVYSNIIFFFFYINIFTHNYNKEVPSLDIIYLVCQEVK